MPLSLVAVLRRGMQRPRVPSSLASIWSRLANSRVETEIQGAGDLDVRKATLQACLEGVDMLLVK